MFVSDWTKRSYRCLRMIISHIVFHYYRDAYAVAKCLIICSVWPFLTRQFSVDTTEHILIFLSSDNPTILVLHIKRDGNILTRSRLMEALKKSRFSTNIVHYLGNDARYVEAIHRGITHALLNSVISNDLE